MITRILDLTFFIFFLSGIVGLLVALAVKASLINFEGVAYISSSIAFIIGYAGGDFLDGIYKIILKKAN